MSKYEPLVRHLDTIRGRSVPMSFEEVERVLGGRLPASARRHQAWWANSGGSHVHALAWMKRGWRTSAVDLAGEKVTFVRIEPGPAGEVGDPGFTLDAARLDPTHRQLLREMARETGGNVETALAQALDMVIRQRRREILRWAAENASKPTNPSDSVDLIREDRDRHAR